MEVHIISREIVKPSSSTPSHLRTYKLSRIDQLNFDISLPAFFFYSSAPKNSDHLKKSLSETLTYYYPFAGRVRDHLTIDCDDYGVSFIQASIAGDMSKLLTRPDFDLLEQLLPYKQHELLTSQFNMAIQLNYFSCGGFAICACFKHVIADASAAVSFMRSWSRIACGDNDLKSEDVVLDFTSIVPPHQDQSVLSTNINSRELPNSSTEIVLKRFVFDGSKIAALREKIDNQSTTRFEAVFALMWGAATAAKRDGEKFVASITVDLRKRMKPRLPEQCIGNLFAVLNSDFPTEKAINYNSFAGKIHELISMVNDENVRKAFPNGWLFDFVSNYKVAKRNFFISGCCSLRLYETDFGWGKPAWATLIGKLNLGDNNIFAILFSTSDGEGVEAWLVMSKEEMAKFEQDPAVIAFTSF
ncbi:hypothetical protein JRO89_XS11G0022300 [Xanthoceras sorbifolium]|uniref:Uncharacterized protein n=1 Tax=Xanthoceras sorbifolium TaxID=99658 RepID=A0ABQ8HEB9_9ROSI|nr:hypothetical protein JRO89_XS11G0022300 [Xanthoceras sorbifolium]